MTEDIYSSKKEPLGQLFQSIARGNPRTLALVKKLAKTAHAIDPDCPYGAHGVLGSIRDYGLSPTDLNKLFKLLGESPLMMNAIDYAIDTQRLDVEDLKKAIKQKDAGNLNPKKVLMQARVSTQGRFARHYRCPSI